MIYDHAGSVYLQDADVFFRQREVYGTTYGYTNNGEEARIWVRGYECVVRKHKIRQI